MKKYILYVFVFFGVGALAQVPQGINYQALIRDNAGGPITNYSGTINIKLTDGSGGPTIYEEDHNVTGNAYGVVSFVIGNGVTGGDFSTIDWSSDIYIDISVGGTSIGVTKFQSVPYAQLADGISGFPLSITSPSNDDILSYNGTNWIANSLPTSPWSVSETDVFYTSGNVGIGVLSPTVKLDIEGGNVKIKPSTTSDSYTMINNLTNNTQLYQFDASNVLSTAIRSNGNSYINGGDVGIGTTAPSEKLDVEGNIQVDGDYMYESAKTRVWATNGSAFTKYNTGDAFDINRNFANYPTYTYLSGGTAGTIGKLVAPLNLPDGATVTSISARMRDNDGSTITTTQLDLVSVSSSSGAVLASCIAVDDGGNQTITTSTSIVINNSTNSYSLVYKGNRDGGTNSSLYFVRITYTVAQAD